MGKIWALYTNELTKISKKISILILAIIMVVGVIGIASLVKIKQIREDKSSNDSSYANKWEIQEDKNQLQQKEGSLAELNKKRESVNETQKYEINVEIATIEVEIECLKLAQEKNIGMHSSTNVFSGAMVSLQQLKIENAVLKLIPSEMVSSEEKATAKANEAVITKLMQAIEKEDFAIYTDAKNEMINNNKIMTDAEKKIEIDANNLWLKVRPIEKENDGTVDNGNSNRNMEERIHDLILSQKKLANNMDLATDGTMQQLTPEKRVVLENKIDVMLYNIEKNAETKPHENTQTMALVMMLSFGMFIIIILIVILAGGAISSEVSTGSIKSLIISPTKRWKIYFAKIFSILTVGIGATLLLYIATVTAFSLFFGASAGNSYVYATGGVVHEINFFLYRFLLLSIDFIDIVVYMMFALMLSTITKNTSVSVSVSIAVYFGGSTVMSMVNSLFQGEWLKFIPFNNLSLSSRVFSLDQSINMMGGITQTVNAPSIAFSLCYVIIIIACMTYIGFDSFNRRDIK